MSLCSTVQTCMWRILPPPPSLSFYFKLFPSQKKTVMIPCILSLDVKFIMTLPVDVLDTIGTRSDERRDTSNKHGWRTNRWLGRRLTSAAISQEKMISVLLHTKQSKVEPVTPMNKFLFHWDAIKSYDPMWSYKSTMCIWLSDSVVEAACKW